MSLRQMFAGSIVKPGFNPLAAQTPSYTYYLNGWGDNQFGQLGISSTANKSSPNQVGSLTDWLTVVTRYNTLALKTNGTMWAWGRNQSGQLGLGNTTYYSSPKQVGALTTWSAVGTINNASMALKSDGTIWTWGGGSLGRLGLSTTIDYSSPKQIGTLTTWAKISTGANLGGFAITTSGALYGWGYNASGQLGLGNVTNYSSPKQIGSLTTWSSVVSGIQNTYAIKTDGTLWSWGANGYGQLGLGNTTYYSSPKQVGALTNWLQVSASEYNALAVKTDGTLWAVGGWNASGTLGLGNTTNYSSPKQVGALTAWASVRLGKNHVIASKTDGTIWTWGLNSLGELASGNTAARSSPVQVGSTNWGYITAGAQTTFALAY